MDRLWLNAVLFLIKVSELQRLYSLGLTIGLQLFDQ